MAYDNAIPAAADRLKDSQPEILENFATISALLGVDHVISPWTDPATGDQGKHNKVTMPEQTVVPTVAANEMAVYTKVSPLSGVNASELFVRRESDGTELNITGSGTGWSYLPSGLLIKWGTVSATRNTLGTITFTVDATTIPAFATILSVQVSQTFAAGPTESNLNVALSAGNYTTTTFQVFPRAIGLPSGSTVSVDFVAIGT